MSDPQQPYGGQPPGPGDGTYGYDEYGRPLPPPQYPDPADGGGGFGPYGGTGGQGPYDTGRPDPAVPPPAQPYPAEPYPAAPDPYAGYGTGYGSEPPPSYAPPADTAVFEPPAQPPPAPNSPSYDDPSQAAQPYPQAAPYAESYGTAEGLPHQRTPYEEAPPGGPEAAAPPAPGLAENAGASEGAAARSAEPQGEYRAEQFSFVEDRNDAAEDVIDWLKFSESRTERRDERKRRQRNRMIALLTVAAVALVCGLGYLLWAGRLPGVSGPGGEEATADGQQRDVIVVHLRQLDSGAHATALLVDNADAGRGTVLLLPNNLGVTVDRGSTTTLGQAVEEEGAAPTRDALSTLLGAQIKGTWRLDTPYLENLVELVGGVTVDTDTTVPGAKKGDKPQVRAGKRQELDGKAAVAYATHRAPGEPQARQLARFGRVLQAVLRKLSTKPDVATRTVRSLRQVPDPSLSEAELGASLAKLAERARDGACTTRLLPVEADGTLSERTSQGLVKEVLGGTVRNSDPDAAVHVRLRVAGADRQAVAQAEATLVNSGYNVVTGGRAAQPTNSSAVTYAAADQAERAREVARTLGLPASAVRRARGADGSDVTVLLGRDFEG